MKKTILLTGATDGIGLETAKMLVPLGHTVLLHGRNPKKLEAVKEALIAQFPQGTVETYVADLAHFDEVEAMAKAVSERHTHLDVLINNAGIFGTSTPITRDKLDVRFAVNTIAPYLLTRRLLPLMDASGRVVNLSSAAQNPVDLEALLGQTRLSDWEAYAQSKLAITMWSRTLAIELNGSGPLVVSVNPGSMLGTNMVKQAFGVDGGDVRIGADILTRAALSDEFEGMTGRYFDNDAKRFSSPHPDAQNTNKSAKVVQTIEEVLLQS